MCGRFALAVDLKTLIEAFGIDIAPDSLSRRYNIAPSQPVAGIRQTEDGQRELTNLRWGLIPFWAKDPAIGHKMINARAETASEKPSFRRAFQARRCLIPASGFFEWKKQERRKIPFYIRSRNHSLLALAGLWESWQGPEGPIETCTILTTEADGVIRHIHHRMPVILTMEGVETWLDSRIDDPHWLKSLLVTDQYSELEMYQVDSLVNSPRNDSRQCLDPVTDKS